MFILILQIFWKYLDDMVGKGIGGWDLIQIIGIISVTVVPLALPLTTLIASLLTFGNMGETFEIVAVKTAGISLLRFMRPLIIFSIFICGVAFYFNNNIIPVANLKFYNFLSNIYNSKPAFELKENVFYTKLDGYAIQVGKKDAAGKNLYDIKIFENGNGVQNAIISAQRATMQISPDKNFLEFTLYNGFRYEERGNRGQGAKNEFIRLGFEKYKKLFDLSKFGIKDLSDSSQKGNIKVLTVGQLQEYIDSIKTDKQKFETQINTSINYLLPIIKAIDSSKKINLKVTQPLQIADSAKFGSFDIAANKASSLISTLDTYTAQFNDKKRALASYYNEWHRKFTLSVACLIMFLIGAPLGAIIRKGGLGMPLLFAVIFFTIFILLNNFGDKLAREGSLNYIVGMWLSNLVLAPIGLFLVYKARNDSQLFNKEYYNRFFKKVKLFFIKNKAKSINNSLAE